MSVIDKTEYAAIAARHGVDLANVKPLSKNARFEKLREILGRTDVPFPIDLEKQAEYLQTFESDTPFDIGNLGPDTVDLGEYKNSQTYDNYSPEEHLSWACLIADQHKTKTKYACREYLTGEEMFQIGDAFIPDFYLLNARVYQHTGWQLATVNMIIPAELFFTCHAKRFFPVTTFMRPLEQDYLEEPDIGHDVAGHVATFTIASVANVMKFHGEARNMIYDERNEKLALATTDSEKQTICDWADELLLYAGRIYWFTVEFGLVMQDGNVRDFGAGILSSPGETCFSIDSPKSNRVLIDPSNDHDLLRLAATDYLISEFQKTYFVMENFDQLGSITPERILAISKLAMELPHFTWRELVPGDNILNKGSVAITSIEKYERLMNNNLLDDAMTRTAIRNLRIYTGDFDTSKLSSFKQLPEPIPSEILDWFKRADAAGTLPVIPGTDSD